MVVYKTCVCGLLYFSNCIHLDGVSAQMLLRNNRCCDHERKSSNELNVIADLSRAFVTKSKQRTGMEKTRSGDQAGATYFVNRKRPLALLPTCYYVSALLSRFSSFPFRIEVRAPLCRAAPSR